MDIYAFGMSILQMLTKQAPYKECTGVGEIYQRVTNHVPPSSLHTISLPSARAFIDCCLAPNPSLRPSAFELLDHPFLKEDKEVDALDVVLSAPPSLPPSLSTGGEAKEEGGEGGGKGGGEGGLGPGMGGVERMTSQESTESGGEGGREGGSSAPGGGGGGGETQTMDMGVSGREGGREGGLVSAKPPSTVQVSNGSKLHLRFFSEPHGPYSEMSSEGEGGREDGEEGGGEEGLFLEGGGRREEGRREGRGGGLGEGDENKFAG